MMKYSCLFVLLNLALDIQCLNPKEFYITPSIPNASCPVHTCNTLSQFSQTDGIVKSSGNVTHLFEWKSHLKYFRNGK